MVGWHLDGGAADIQVIGRFVRSKDGPSRSICLVDAALGGVFECEGQSRPKREMIKGVEANKEVIICSRDWGAGGWKA